MAVKVQIDGAGDVGLYSGGIEAVECKFVCCCC